MPQHFSISPSEFWRLSLTEWRALAGPAPTLVLPRADFDALAAAYPDHQPPDKPL